MPPRIVFYARKEIAEVHVISADVLRHRLALSYEASAERVSAHAVADRIIKREWGLRPRPSTPA